MVLPSFEQDCETPAIYIVYLQENCNISFLLSALRNAPKSRKNRLLAAKCLAYLYEIKHSFFCGQLYRCTGDISTRVDLMDPSHCVFLSLEVFLFIIQYRKYIVIFPLLHFIFKCRIKFTRTVSQSSCVPNLKRPSFATFLQT